MTMLTRDRALEIHEKQTHFPYWGNYSKFMTADEIAYCEKEWKADPEGSITFATVVRRIAGLEE